MDFELELNNHLESVRDEQDKEHEDLKVDEFYASQALYCPRKIQWEKKNKVEFEAKTLRKFLMGNLLHDYLQNNIFTEEKGYKCEERVETKAGLIKVRGRVDVESDEEIIEIKSIARLPKEPLEHHIAQLGIYMHETGKNGRLLYIEKTSGSMIDFEIDKETADIAYRNAIRGFKKVFTADKKKVEAPAKSTWLCRFCKHLDCSYNKAKSD